jgi:cytosine/adenosine deaminase-related metal-dependent hydrolase
MMTQSPRKIACSHVIGPVGPSAGAQTITIDGGRIASIDPSASAPMGRLLAMPALANAHDHGRALRTSSIGADAKPLESWLHYLALFPAVDPYLAAAMAFANSARGGAGTVMVHYTRAQGLTDFPTEAAEVARAARDVGVRAGFAISVRDRNPLVYGPTEPVMAALPPELRGDVESRFLRKPPTPQEYLALVDASAAAAAGPDFDVQYGPNGVQWCSEALLTAIAEASERSGRHIHMHLLETRYQRQWADTAYPEGMVRMLDRIGLLSPRLTLAHCVWARPDELELLAERGVTISINTSSNLHLHSGMAPVLKMLQAGCNVALGIDSKALDDDDDSLRELRLAYLLHTGNGFELASTRHSAVRTCVGHGRFSVTNVRSSGALEKGAAADMLLLDWDALDDDGLRDDLDPLNIVFSRATARHIRELIVGGRSVVRDGTVLGIDLPAIRKEVLAQTRAGMAGNGKLLAAIQSLEQATCRHYHGDAPCC